MDDEQHGSACPERHEPGDGLDDREWDDQDGDDERRSTGEPKLKEANVVPRHGARTIVSRVGFRHNAVRDSRR
jgi:hypothetical protein